MVEMLTTSKVREFLKKRGLRTDEESLEALEKSFKRVIDDSVSRAKANDRTTLLARDC